MPRHEFTKRWTGYAALYDYTEEFRKAPEEPLGLKLLGPFFRPLASTAAQALALAVIISALHMLLPVFTQVLVDRVLFEKNVGLLHVLILAMGVVLVFMTLATLVQRYLISFVVARVDAGALDFLSRKMLALPLTYFLARRTGDIQRRLEGTRKVREFLVQNGVRALEGRIRLENVGYQYGGPEAPKILDGITLEIPPGHVVAVVGRSGSGKTTLVKCLTGLLTPTTGTIFFNGADMKTLNYRDLRRQIGFVPQENHLFGDTIARNIAFGEDEPDMERVLWAARMAHAHEFVDRLPLGYDTPVGESGLGLSGGQRQRLALARALYHRPPILIFDEATSALDTESERAVKENLDQLLKGRTAFVIAHHLNTIREADLILVLEKGKLAEVGNHEQLMDRKGLYYYLNSQLLNSW
jgi:ABC-type bacteriocin/lantibiotic exporter with double-glycine peptidase domain